MSREMTIKLNQILYQRSKDWLDKKPNTGILKLLDGRTQKKEDKESFDDYLRDHIKTSNKSINIRGLFRVPDVSQGEQLMIHVDEREEEEKNPSFFLKISERKKISKGKKDFEIFLDLSERFLKGLKYFERQERFRNLSKFFFLIFIKFS